MEYQNLGKSDISISRIGFGCMSLEAGNPLNEELLRKAVDVGINYFDTADLYQQGLNESVVGRALRGHRKNVVIATKAGNQWRADGSGWDWNPDPKYLLSAFEESLRRLQTDYIDLYQLHGGTLDDPIEEIIRLFETLKKQGRIRQYGISSIRANVIREYVKRSEISSVMMQYSVLDRRPEETVMPLLFEHGIAVLARGVLAKGLLVSKPPERFLNYSSQEVERVAETIKTISGGNRSQLETAMRFALQNKTVSSAVIGIRTLEQLQAAIQVFDSPKMNDDEFRTLSQVLTANTYQDHR